jgi:hypothetical protein
VRYVAETEAYVLLVTPRYPRLAPRLDDLPVPEATAEAL